jgi:hypothetical protein
VNPFSAIHVPAHPSATVEDSALILRFIIDLAIYEKAEHEVKTHAIGIQASFVWCRQHRIRVDASWTAWRLPCRTFHYSTHIGKHGLYLEDLLRQS